MFLESTLPLPAGQAIQCRILVSENSIHLFTQSKWSPSWCAALLHAPPHTPYTHTHRGNAWLALWLVDKLFSFRMELYCPSMVKRTIAEGLFSSAEVLAWLRWQCTTIMNFGFCSYVRRCGVRVLDPNTVFPATIKSWWCSQVKS